MLPDSSLTDLAMN